MLPNRALTVKEKFPDEKDSRSRGVHNKNLTTGLSVKSPKLDCILPTVHNWGNPVKRKIWIFRTLVAQIGGDEGSEWSGRA